MEASKMKVAKHNYRDGKSTKRKEMQAEVDCKKLNIDRIYKKMRQAKPLLGYSNMERLKIYISVNQNIIIEIFCGKEEEIFFLHTLQLLSSKELQYILYEKNMWNGYQQFF